MKIAYFGFDLFFDCLELISRSNEIIKIFTCKVDGDFETNTLTYSLAKKLGIEITDEKVTVDMITDLENRGCELIVCAGYYYKIPVSEKIKAINIHPSLLPEGKGPWPFPHIFLKSIKKTGVTIHEIEKNFDTGCIISQCEITVSDNDNLETLTHKTHKCAKNLLNDVLLDFDVFWQSRKVQKQGSYWLEPTVNDMTFTPNDTFESIDRKVRAFYGYHCFLKCENKIIKIKKAICVKSLEQIPDELVANVKLSDGYLCILKLA